MTGILNDTDVATTALLEHGLIRLEWETFVAFQAALTAPKTTMPKIREIMQRRPPWERSTDSSYP